MRHAPPRRTSTMVRRPMRSGESNMKVQSAMSPDDLHQQVIDLVGPVIGRAGAFLFHAFGDPAHGGGHAGGAFHGCQGRQWPGAAGGQRVKARRVGCEGGVHRGEIAIGKAAQKGAQRGFGGGGIIGACHGGRGRQQQAKAQCFPTVRGVHGRCLPVFPLDHSELKGLS